MSVLQSQRSAAAGFPGTKKNLPLKAGWMIFFICWLRVGCSAHQRSHMAGFCQPKQGPHLLYCQIKFDANISICIRWFEAQGSSACPMYSKFDLGILHFSCPQGPRAVPRGGSWGCRALPVLSSQAPAIIFCPPWHVTWCRQSRIQLLQSGNKYVYNVSSLFSPLVFRREAFNKFRKIHKDIQLHNFINLKSVSNKCMTTVLFYQNLQKYWLYAALSSSCPLHILNLQLRNARKTSMFGLEKKKLPLQSSYLLYFSILHYFYDSFSVCSNILMVCSVLQGGIRSTAANRSCEVKYIIYYYESVCLINYNIHNSLKNE